MPTAESSANATHVGASALLFLSSLPRIAKGPVPATLAVTAALSGVYYGRTFVALRK
jgi:hypothetical protein